MCIEGIPVPIYQDAGELNELRAMVRGLKAKRILEIGSLYGGTLFAWMQDAPGSRIVSVDTGVQVFDGRHEDIEAARGLWPEWATAAGCELIQLRTDSTAAETVTAVAALGPFDFIFVDGGHTYDVAMADFTNYWPLLREGGLMAFHDIAYPDDNPIAYSVGRVFREVKARGTRSWEIVRPNNPEGIWGIGVLEKGAPKKQKILVFCPTYNRNGLDEHWPDSETSLEALRAPEGVEVVKVVGRDNPHDIRVNHRYRNTLHQFKNAQRMALEGGYDALCTFESDMLVPEDGLIRLWGTDADVVYGLYVLRHNSNVVNAFRLIIGSPNIDQSVSLFPELYAKGVQEGILEVSGCGMGFTLIRRPVLERFEFRQWDPSGSYAPDWALASDCQAAGVRQVCRFDVACGHIEDSGMVLWPGKGSQMKVLVRENFTRGVVYTAGETVYMPINDAIEMSRCGFVEIIEIEDGLSKMATPRRPAVEEAVIGPAERAVTRGKRA
jgi:predicted O-methyltransferase YrrM